MNFSYTIKIIITVLLANISQNTLAYSPVPLTPSWLVSIKNSIFENTSNVWRGIIIDAPTPTTLLIKSTKGHTTSVNLIHLSALQNSTGEALRIIQNTSKSLIGMQVYVLGEPNKEFISAKILDMDGNDINLNFISNGLYDLNTASLTFKPEKQQYLNAWMNAKRSRLGIWN